MKNLFLLLSILIALPAWSTSDEVIKVEIIENENGFTLMRGGEPYYIKGAGGQKYMDKMVECGANSLRTWNYDGAQKILDEAHKRGLTVTMGIWLGQERQGFDYNDEWAVKGQFEAARKAVERFKDHPALLMWGLGNELDLFYTNYKAWDALEEIAAMVHEVDPNHPVMTVIAGIHVPSVQLIRDKAPSIDVLGVNAYAEIFAVPKKIDLYGWEKPYVITEWGPTGTWEVFKTEWGAPVDINSTKKAKEYEDRYENYIAEDKEQCIGSYVFLWGNKQEATSTWFSMFTEDGKETGAVDAMQYCWSGEWPENKCPKIESFLLDGKTGYDNIYLKPSKTYTASTVFSDPEGDALKTSYELYSEVSDYSAGGDVEEAGKEIEGFVTDRSDNKITFKVPSKKGAYRLHIFIYDGNNNVATANIPFYVE